MIRRHDDYWLLLEPFLMEPLILNQIVYWFSCTFYHLAFRESGGVEWGGGELAYPTGLLKVNMLLAWSNLIQALFNLMCINKAFMQ